MFAYSFIFFPAILAIASIIIWWSLRDLFALTASVGFWLIFASGCVQFFISPGTIENGIFMPSHNFDLYNNLSVALSRLGTLIAPISLLIFSLQAKKYARNRP